MVISVSKTRPYNMFYWAGVPSWRKQIGNCHELFLNRGRTVMFVKV